MAANVRKNQKDLNPQEWQTFIDAINQTHGVSAAPLAYRSFVQVHEAAMSAAGMAWSVHTMPGMGVGRNFLAWHRQYLVQFEKRLQVVHPTITLPYWDWIVQPTIPQPLSDPALLTSWSVTRDWHPEFMPHAADLAPVLAKSSFRPFQTALERLHGSVHIAVGGPSSDPQQMGTMATAHSPADPVFWLHHANIDRLWAQWEAAHANAAPPNAGEVLQPTQWQGVPLFGVPVSAVLSIPALNYSYA